MKLELNLPALERLIGGDTEIELALRKQIVHEFSTRHLLSVAQSTGYAAALDAAKQYVNEAAKESFGIENLATSHLWPTVGYRLKSMIETLVKEQAQAVAAQMIEAHKHYWTRVIKLAIDAEMDKQIEQQIQAGIQQRLATAAMAQSIAGEKP